MHDAAYEWIRRYATTKPVTVLDLGGRVINGSPRYLWPNATVYRTVDIAPGPGVDVVADAADWQPDQQYDVVLSAECFEHTARWREICATAFAACRPGGRLILTMAGPGRPEHSGIDGEWRLHPGEYYGNVDPAELWRVLSAAGFHRIFVDQQPFPADVRAAAVRPNVPVSPLPASLTRQG
jgi:hypothetical protein